MSKKRVKKEAVIKVPKVNRKARHDKEVAKKAEKKARAASSKRAVVRGSARAARRVGKGDVWKRLTETEFAPA
jgi:hypothetical protein